MRDWKGKEEKGSKIHGCTVKHRREERGKRMFVEKYLPLCVHLAAKVMPAVPAKMLPSETVLASKVAAVPAVQKILLELAPPTRMTLRCACMFSVVGVRKIQTASEMALVSFIPASRMRSPEWTERHHRRSNVRSSFTCFEQIELPTKQLDCFRGLWSNKSNIIIRSDSDSGNLGRVGI